MIKEQDHIIQKVDIEIDVPDIKTARHIYANFSELWNTKLIPELERALKNSFPGNLFVRYQKLSLEFTTRSVEEIEDVLTEQLPGKLISIVSCKTNEEPIKNPENWNPVDPGNELATDNDPAIISLYGKILNNFIFFLRHGEQEWYVSQQQNWLDEALVAEAIRNSEKAIWLPLFQLLSASPVVAERLFSQFTSSFCFFIVHHFSSASGIAAPETDTFSITEEDTTISPFKTTLKQLLKILAAEITRKGDFSSPVLTEVNRVLHKTGTGNILPAAIKEDDYVIPGLALFQKTHTGQADQTAEAGKETSGIYIQHAGLILLHPFLHYFFKNLGLLRGEEFAGKDSKETAVHLVYFLATGHEQPYEHELIFEKYLCAWPHDFPVNRFVTLTDGMKQEAEQLLKAVIHHWKVLKNSSPTSLREGFLQRNGKLVLADQQHKLLVEKSSIDILLDQLPWSHSIITLPWLKKVLYTEWPTN